MGDGWAWVSLSAYGDGASSADLARWLPGSVPSRRNPHLASVRFTGRRSDGGPLQDLLADLADYLTSHQSELQELLAVAQFQLRIGWSPMSPQESIAMPAMLLRELADLRADLMVDGYGESNVDQDLDTLDDRRNNERSSS